MNDDQQESPQTQEEQEATQRLRVRRRNDELLMRARGAQDEQEKQAEERRIEFERKAWDQTIEHIRCIQQQDFDR